MEARSDASQSDKQPWRLAYSLQATTLAPADRKDVAFRSPGKQAQVLLPSHVHLWTTAVGGGEIVSGITFRTQGHVRDIPGLQVPTAAFPWLINGKTVQAYLFGAERDLADQQKLRDLDECNAPMAATHWSVYSPPPCDLGTFPRQPYAYAIESPTGVMVIEIRDATLGLDHLRKQKRIDDHP